MGLKGYFPNLTEGDPKAIAIIIFKGNSRVLPLKTKECKNKINLHNCHDRITI